MGKIYSIGPRKSFEPLPTGEYVLTLRKWEVVVEEKDSQYSKKGDEKVQWTWEVTVPGDEPTTRHTKAAPPTSWNEKSIFVKIAEALRLVDHDKAVAEGADINWDIAINKQCMGTILKSLKEGSQTEWTDNIKAYAPMPAAAAQPASASGGSKLLFRARALFAFAGRDPDRLTAQMSNDMLTEQMRIVGALSMTPEAKKHIAELLEMHLMATGTNYDMGDINLDDMMLKHGLLLADKIQGAIDA